MTDRLRQLENLGVGRFKNSRAGDPPAFPELRRAAGLHGPNRDV